MGTKTGGRSSQTSTTVLPAHQQANVDTLMRDSLAYYNGGGPKYYQGETVAGPNQEQQQARQATINYSQGQGQQTVNNTVAANNRWLDPNMLMNNSSIPGYDATRQGIINDATRTLTDSTLPVIRDEAIMNGQYGGTSQQIGEALAVSRTNEGVAQQLGSLDLGIYDRNLGMHENAINRGGAMYDLGLAPMSTREGIGAMGQADQQAQIDADVSKWNFEQMAPLLNLQAFQGLTGSAGQYGGTTTSSGTQGASDGGSGWMQLAGTAIMALAMMSHSSTKEEVVPAEGFLAKLRELEINTWQYKGDNIRHVGPMAEEFQRIFGVGDGFTINVIDVCGVVLGAMKELAQAVGVKAHG